MNGFASKTKFLPPCSILSVSTVRLSLSSCTYNGCMGVFEQCWFHGNSVLMMHPLIQIVIVVALPGNMCDNKIYWRLQNTMQTFTAAAVGVNMRSLDTVPELSCSHFTACDCCLERQSNDLSLIRHLMLGQSAFLSCWALRPLSGPRVSEVGRQLDSDDLPSPAASSPSAP